MGETPTPVPYKKLLPLAIIYFIEAFVFTNIFSYVGFMVLSFSCFFFPYFSASFSFTYCYFLFFFVAGS